MTQPAAYYRSDITGLRAVAVLMVIAFHADVRVLAGGYVGVDVFFVISGFLISKIIFEQIDAGRFSFASFCMRRIQRIVPALLVMMCLTMLAGFFLLYPTELTDLAKSEVAAIFSFSNIFFWINTGYFDGPAISKPMLHTWSLGVEEQFYLLFPMLTLAMCRVRRVGRTTWLVALLVLSLATSVFLVATDPSSAFYLPQSRVWEFVVGAMLSSGAVRPPVSRPWRETLAAAGLGAILLAALVFNGATPFPGLAALLPCLGTAAVIAAGVAGPTAAGRLLSLPPMAVLGTISYSLYLYHWPFIVFQRMDGIVNVSQSVVFNRALLFGLIMLVSFLSWRYVETPFRTLRVRSRITATSLAMTPMVVIGAIGLFVVLSGGWPSRFSPEAIRVASFLKYDPDQDMRTGSCFLYNSMPFRAFDQADCMHRVGLRPTVLLFGDSHAGHLYPGLEKMYGDRADILQATATGCKPLLRDASLSSTCGKMVDYVFNTYLPAHPVNLLIISARWAEADIPFIEPTLARLEKAGIRTMLVGPTPEYDVQLPSLIARSGTSSQGRITRHLEPEFSTLDSQIGQIVGNWPNITYFSPYRYLCDTQSCHVLAYGDPLFYDKGHLTRSGSLLVVKEMPDLINML